MVLLFLATSIRTEKYILTVAICCLGLLDTGPLLMFLHAMMISALLFPLRSVPALSRVQIPTEMHKDLIWLGLLTVG